MAVEEPFEDGCEPDPPFASLAAREGGVEKSAAEVAAQSSVDVGQGQSGRSRLQAFGPAAAWAAGAARRAHQRGTDTAARVLSEERITAASQKVGAVLADERTKALLAASARASARAA